MKSALTLAVFFGWVFGVAAVHAALAPTSPNPGLRHYYEVPRAANPLTLRVDVCVYGGTPGGVGAAVQARRMGKTTALAVFRRHVGGLTAAGLTAVDRDKKESIGGMAAEFWIAWASRAVSVPRMPRRPSARYWMKREFQCGLSAGLNIVLSEWGLAHWERRSEVRLNLDKLD